MVALAADGPHAGVVVGPCDLGEIPAGVHQGFRVPVYVNVDGALHERGDVGFGDVAGVAEHLHRAIAQLRPLDPFRFERLLDDFLVMMHDRHLPRIPFRLTDLRSACDHHLDTTIFFLV